MDAALRGSIPACGEITPWVAVAARFGLSRSSVWRHGHDHLGLDQRRMRDERRWAKRLGLDRDLAGDLLAGYDPPDLDVSARDPLDGLPDFAPDFDLGDLLPVAADGDEV